MLMWPVMFAVVRGVRGIAVIVRFDDHVIAGGMLGRHVRYSMTEGFMLYATATISGLRVIGAIAVRM